MKAHDHASEPNGIEEEDIAISASYAENRRMTLAMTARC
jgi:hypothetical protein